MTVKMTVHDVSTLKVNLINNLYTNIITKFSGNCFQTRDQDARNIRIDFFR